MSTEKSAADVLAESREYLERNGWWRGSLLGPNGRQVCAYGAILYSQGYGSEQEGQKSIHVLSALKALIQVLPKKTLWDGNESQIPMPLTDWNDHEAANKQEVLDLFAKAEKIERAGFDPDAP